MGDLISRSEPIATIMRSMHLTEYHAKAKGTVLNATTKTVHVTSAEIAPTGSGGGRR